MMIIEIQEKIHVMERRYFEEELRRHFVGEVVACTENAIRVRGYTWIFDKVKATFIRKPEKRERVIYPTDRTTINIIPKEIDLDELKYSIVAPKGLCITDGKKFSLEVSEFTAMR